MYHRLPWHAHISPCTPSSLLISVPMPRTVSCSLKKIGFLQDRARLRLEWPSTIQSGRRWLRLDAPTNSMVFCISAFASQLSNDQIFPLRFVIETLSTSQTLTAEDWCCRLRPRLRRTTSWGVFRDFHASCSGTADWWVLE